MIRIIKNLNLLENFKEEIEEEFSVDINEIAQLSLGIDWNYYEPYIDHKLLSEIFEENLDII